MLKNGTTAPDFELPDAFGRMHTLSGLRQNKIGVLYFFRGEFCPTSGLDLAGYGDAYQRFQMLGADVAAISTSAPDEHGALQQRLGLPFPLLSDADFGVSRSYGVYESDDDEGPQPHGEPALVIVDVDGRVAYSQVLSGPKGIASPADVGMILLYMAANRGHY